MKTRDCEVPRYHPATLCCNPKLKTQVAGLCWLSLYKLNNHTYWDLLTDRALTWSKKDEEKSKQQTYCSPLGYEVVAKYPSFRGTNWIHLQGISLEFFHQKMEAVCSPEMFVSTYQTIWYHNPHGHNVSLYWYGKLKCSRRIIKTLCDLKWLPSKCEQGKVPLHHVTHWRHK